MPSALLASLKFVPILILYGPSCSAGAWPVRLGLCRMRAEAGRAACGGARKGLFAGGL